MTFVDNGEPGRDDTVEIVIEDADGNVVLEIAAPTELRNGNHQAHSGE